MYMDLILFHCCILFGFNFILNSYVKEYFIIIIIIKHFFKRESEVQLLSIKLM